MKKLFLFICFFGLMTVNIFSQAFPKQMNYQGVLKDASGVVVSNGDYNIKFTMYENDVEIWTETKSITVTDGIVNTQLGGVTPINLPFDNEYWLGITIGTENELTPRLKLSSVPYSYMSMNVPDGSITAQELNQMGATNGQVLKWNGTNWMPSSDETGGVGFTLPYTGSVTQTTGFALDITSNGSSCIKGEGTIGVIGRSNSESSFGYGITGSSGNTTQPHYGVFGTSNSVVGTGIYGLVYQTTGTPIAIKGETRSSAGFSGYYTGGRFYVDSKVGIGTEIPAYKLDIAGVTNLNSGITSGIALRCNGDEALWYNGNYFSWGYASVYNFVGNKLRIGGNGNLEPAYTLYVDGTAAKSSAGTAWIVSSDRRLKDVLGNYKRGLADIVELQPIQFKYKENNPRNLPSEKEEIGFVAQDVQKIFPEAVTEAEDGYLDFNIHAINIALVNAVKELKAENDELKARLEKIEKHLNSMSMK